MGLKNSKNQWKTLGQGEEYKVIQNIYPDVELKYVLPHLKPETDDYILMDKLKEVFIKVDGLDEDELEEIIFYACLTSDPNDVEYIKNHPESCHQCGWCCRNCDPILLRPEDVKRLACLDNISEYNSKYYKLKIPCIYLEGDKCGVYKDRPNSCKTFPIGLKNLTLVVQRTIECGMVFDMLMHKVKAMCDMVKVEE